MVISTLKITLKQHKSLISKNIIDKTGHLLVLLPPLKKGSQKPPAWPNFPYSEQLQKRWKDRTASVKEQALLVTDLPNNNATRVFLTTASANSNAFKRLNQAREIIAAALVDNPDSLVLVMPGLDEEQQTQCAETLISAALAACHSLPSFSKKHPAARKLKAIHIYGCEAKLDTRRLLTEADGNNLARSLTALPPNKLAPKDYLKQIRILAKTQGWKLEFLDHKALLRKKAGAFLAVSQGSDHKDAGIVHLSYRPSTAGAAKNLHRLALVGKGICFDTGGTNLKPAKFMHGMHEDMQGSAVALGTLLTLSQLKVPFAIDCWLALAENHIGPNAYKQNDVVTACNGTTIEVMHTDAEGRMVLADTLALAARSKPDLIIDYATLTGTCIYALGTHYSGVFTNRDRLRETLIEAGRDSGERVWPFPMDEDFDTALESQVADIKQCTLGGEPDHILAARFLQRFVDERPWIHIDLAAGNNKGGLAHIPSDITGFGVRFTVKLLLDKVLDKDIWHAID
jgi:leucyl aminopeptidase